MNNIDKNDIQSRIRQAFLDLAEEEPSLQGITTTQVLKRAKVSRSTFYSYYENKEDLLQDIMSLYYWEMASAIQNVFPSRQGLEGYRPVYLLICNLMYQHPRFFCQLYEVSDYQNQAVHFIYNYVFMQYQEMMPQYSENILRLAAIGTSSSLYGILRYWAQNGYAVPPNEYVDQIIESLRVSMKRMVPNKLD